MLRSIALVVVLAGCGGLRSTHDGGMGGGSGGGTTGSGGGTSGTGGGSTAGGSGTGGGSAGASGGGSGTGGGASGPLHYASLSIPDTAGSMIIGLSGRSGEVWAISDSSTLFRSTGGGFTEIYNHGITYGRGIWVASDGSVFPVGLRQLGICRANCTMGMSYTLTTLSASEDVYAVCGSSATDVYAVTEDTQYIAGLWHSDGSTWTKTVPNLGGLKSPRGCAMMGDGTLVVTGQKSIAFHSNGVTTVETAATVPPLTQNEADFQQWYGVTQVGAKLYAVGQYRRISVRTAADTWAMTTFTNATDTLWAVGGVNDNEVLVGGGLANGTDLRIFNGTMWRDAPALPTVVNARCIFAAGPNEFWIGGTDSNGDPAVDKAYR